MEAPDPFPSLRREDPALLGVGAGDSRDFSEDADPAASPDGKRRDGAADRPPSGAAQGRIRADGLGSGSLPGARRLAEMGGAARGDGRRGRRCEQRVKASLYRTAASAWSATKFVMYIPAVVGAQGLEPWTR